MEQTNTTELFLNYTDFEYVDAWPFTPCWFSLDNARLIMAFLCTVICLCGLVGNTLVVWFLGFHMKKNPFTVYVLNLAIADFSLLLFFLAVITLDYIERAYCIYSVQVFLTSYALSALFLFWYFASMYLLTAISIERCLSALFPIWYRCHRPRRLSGIVCGVLWALAGLVSLPFLVQMNPRGLIAGLGITNSVVFSLLPLVSNLSLLIKLRCSSQRRHPGRLYIAILLSAIFLFLFGVPLNVALLIYHGFYLHGSYLDTFSLLASLNSSINPLIYFLVGSYRQRRFQGSVKTAFQRVFEEKANNEEKTQVQGHTTAVTTV